MNGSFLRFCAIFYLAMGGLGCALAFAGGRGEFFRPPDDPPGAAALALFLALLLQSFSAGLLFTRTGKRLVVFFLRALPEFGAGGVLLLAVSSGVAEEALFRGALLPLLGFPLSTLLFGFMHYPAHRALRVWTLFALAAGFAFGLLTLRTGSALPAMAAHALVNAGGFALLLRLRRRTRRGAEPATAAGAHLRERPRPGIVAPRSERDGA